MKKKFVLITLFFILQNLFIFSESGKWVLAASKFSTASSSQNEAVEEACETLPQLILDCLEGKGSRTMEEFELSARVLYELRQEREELFAELTNELQTRDSIFITASSKIEQQRLEKQSKKKIESLKNQINLNLQKAAEPLGKDPEYKRKWYEAKDTIHYISLERPGDRLSISLWQNDSSMLFDDSREEELESVYISRFLDESISGLIKGSVSERAGFLQVTVQLNVFPQNTVTATVSELGSLTELQTLAAIIAHDLYPYILNTKPVKLRFEISPPEAAAIAKIYIDGLLPDESNELEIENGKHKIYIYAAGYESKEFLYSFTETDEYIIQVKMPLKKQTLVAFSSQSQKGTYYTNAFPVEDSKRAAVEKGVSLGEFVSDKDGHTDYFTVENRTNRTDTSNSLVFKDVSFKASLADISADIEKSRTAMYNSYAALLISLPFTFISNGMRIAEKNSVLYDRSYESKYNTWKQFSTYSNVVSITLGANFLFQLGRYLYKANSILPKNIVIDEESNNKGGNE